MRHTLEDAPTKDAARPNKKKNPTISITNAQRWRSTTAHRTEAFLRATAAAHLQHLNLDAEHGVRDLLAEIDAQRDTETTQRTLAVLSDMARSSDTSADFAYAAAVAVSATTLRDIDSNNDVTIDKAVFPGTIADLTAKFTAVFTRPPPAGDINADTLGYMLLKALPFRCWTRKASTVLDERFEGPGYRNRKKPTESAISKMNDAAISRRLITRIILCSLLGNYKHCEPSSRPTLAQRKLLVSAFDYRVRASTACSGAPLAICKGIIKRGAMVIKLAVREHICSLIDADQFLAEYAATVMNYAQFRSHTISLMDRVRRDVATWTEQCTTNDGDAMFNNFARIKLGRYNCTYKKPADPPLFVLTAHIGMHYGEKNKLEKDLSDDEEEQEIDWRALLRTLVAEEDEKKQQPQQQQQLEQIPVSTATPEEGLNIEHCRRIAQYVQALPTDITQEEICEKHLSVILRVCGVPAPCIKRIETIVHAYLHDEVKPTRAKRTRQTQALRAAYPYAMRVLCGVRATWQRHQMTKTPLPRWYVQNQADALRGRFDLATPAVAAETTKFVFCRSCREVYTIVHRHKSNSKQVYRDGFVDAILDVKSGDAYCGNDGAFGHQRCRQQPLVEIDLIGCEFKNYTGDAIALCPQVGCGQPFEIDCEFNLSTERGIACNECSMNLVERQLHDLALAVLDHHAVPEGGYQCQFPGCGTRALSMSHVHVYGSLRVCSAVKHKHRMLLSYLEQTLPAHILRHPERPEYGADIYKAMLGFKARREFSDKRRAKQNEKRFKAAAARDRQNQRR